MGLLGPSKSELEARIDELEGRCDELHTRVKRTEKAADRAGECANQIQRSLEGIVDQYKTVEDKNDVVETLDTPKVAWKATQNYIVKLLIPEGATVVHPVPQSYGPRKKRTDVAIVVQFYEVGDTFENQLIPTRETVDRSKRTKYFTYEVGERITPDCPLATNTDVECTDGIHFFCSQEAAIDWL